MKCLLLFVDLLGIGQGERREIMHMWLSTFSCDLLKFQILINSMAYSKLWFTFNYYV